MAQTNVNDKSSGKGLDRSLRAQTLINDGGTDNKYGLAQTSLLRKRAPVGDMRPYITYLAMTLMEIAVTRASDK